MRLIRLDDFPYGHPSGFSREWCYPRIAEVCRIFNKNGIPFILGCVPLVLSPRDCEILRHILPPNGRAVMHGFTHGFDFPATMWNHIEATWPLGGEFIGMDDGHVERKYTISDIIMRSELGTLYDSNHFVSPFNVSTQSLVRVLRRHGVRYLHTADIEHNSEDWFSVASGGDVLAVVSEHEKTYCWVDKVIEHLDNPSQITLHWSFDCQANPDTWMDKYNAFAEAIVSHEIAV